MWQCTGVADSNNKLRSICTYLCGNKWLDIVLNTITGFGIANSVSGNPVGPTAKEPCDLLSQPYSGQSLATVTGANPNGYINYNSAWVFNYAEVGAPPTNNNWGYQNIGCTQWCEIRTDAPYICPPDNSYTNIQYSWTTNGPTSTITSWPSNANTYKLTNPDLRCTDRCHNGEYDGSYPQAGRY